MPNSPALPPSSSGSASDPSREPSENPASDTSDPSVGPAGSSSANPSGVPGPKQSETSSGEPAPAEPAAAEPAHVEPAPAEPAPVEPAPTEPAPAEPAPAEPGAGKRQAGKPAAGKRQRLSGVRRLLPGLLAAVVAVALAHLAHTLVPAVPVLTAAVVLGLLAANIPGLSAAAAGVWRPGLGFAARKFLRIGIVLLGLKVSLVDIAGLGWIALVLIVVLVLAAFAGTYAICRLFRLPGDEPVLIAAGFSICGVSAIGAMAAVRKSRTEDTLVPVALVTLCGTAAIAALPLVGGLLQLGPEVFGTWVGASVHDVGQVVATAQTAGVAALAAAVVVKLARVVLLAPMTAAAGVLARRKASRDAAAGLSDAGTGKRPPLVPLFVVGFLVLILVRTTGVLPESVLDAAAVVQDLLFAAALFGLGAGVRIGALFASGVRAVAAALASWVLVAGLGLGVAVLLVQ